MMSNLKDRIKEPSTWAGLGLLVQGVAQVYLSKGGDSTAYATIAAGVGAIFLPEKTAYESSNL